MCFHLTTTEGPLFGLRKEAKNEGLFKPRTSTIEKRLHHPKNKNTNKRYF
jgi:hypothetical protein